MRLARIAPVARRALVVALALSLAQVPLVYAVPPDEQLEAGVKQVEGGEFDAAVVTLDGVVRRLATSGREPKDLTRAYTYLAIAYLGLAQEQSAKARFLDALRAEPGLTLDPGQFPPKVVQFFEQVRADQAAAGAPAPAASPAAKAATTQPAAKAATTTAAAPPEEKKGGSKALLVLLGVGAAAGIGVAAAGGGGGGGSSTPPPPTTIPAPTLADLSAAVTSPQHNSNISCTSNVFVTVTLTNRSRGSVSITGVRRETATRVGGCPSSAPFTYSPATSTVGPGASAAVLNRNLFASAAGCCNGPCGGSFCELQKSFTVMTSLGDVPAGAIGYGITFRNCPQCSSSVSASEGGLGCPQAER